MKKVFLLLAAIALTVFVVFGPTAYHKQRAKSFVQFARNGVTVRVIGTARDAGNPILVPSGVGLFLANEFELTNSRGEKRRLVLCNGHPGYYRLLLAATPSTFANWKPSRVVLQMAEEPLEDPHKAGGWWVNHLGFERYLQIAEEPAAAPLNSRMTAKAAPALPGA